MKKTLQSQLAGTWRLHSYETVHANGSIDYPFGEDAKGLLVYTADGFMNGQVMRCDREHLPRGYRLEDATEEATRAAVAAFTGYIAYCGRYEVDESTGEVVHHVEASLYPNWVGGEQRRKVSLDGQRMTLSVSRHVRGGTLEHRLVWERA